MRSSDKNQMLISYSTEQLLDNAILVLRTALAGIDLLLNRTEDAEFRSFFLGLRLTLHETLDKAIRKKRKGLFH
jgi:hypothetical protein